MKKLSVVMMLVALALWTGSSAVGTTIYSNTFDTLTDVSTSGPGFASVAAPGGKSGNALHMSGGSGGTVDVTPTVSGFPVTTESTTLFRFYTVTADSGFNGAYDYSPGDGFRFWPNGDVLGSSPIGSGWATWTTGTWYTAAMYYSGNYSYPMFYLKQGANAVLSDADFLGYDYPITINKTKTSFWNYAGTGNWYVDDYTVNTGKDFSMVPEPVTLMLLCLGLPLAWRKRS